MFLDKTLNPFGLGQNTYVDQALEANLFAPEREFSKHSGKKIRSQILKIAHELTEPTTSKIKDFESKTKSNETHSSSPLMILSEVVDMIHNASLIIDDIQDSSKRRRNTECAHIVYGTPLSINLGNWMYFEPMTKIAKLNLSDSQKNKIYSSFFQNLSSGHMGQALDIGCDVLSIPKYDQKQLCLSNISLKTGSLTKLAGEFGCLSSKNWSEESLEQIGKYFQSFGIFLQAYDDLGNILNKNKTEKLNEDLKLKRPCFWWAELAENLSEKDFSIFLKKYKKALKENNFDDFKTDVSMSIQRFGSLQKVHNLFDKTYEDFVILYNDRVHTIEKLFNLKELLKNAYTK